jgi:hypothetical protein
MEWISRSCFSHHAGSLERAQNSGDCHLPFIQIKETSVEWNGMEWNKMREMSIVAISAAAMISQSLV